MISFPLLLKYSRAFASSSPIVNQESIVVINAASFISCLSASDNLPQAFLFITNSKGAVG